MVRIYKAHLTVMPSCTQTCIEYAEISRAKPWQAVLDFPICLHSRRQTISGGSEDIIEVQFTPS